MTSPIYDAIVVGGGPAGSSAAHRLARAGARVLLLEKKTMPRVKPCGGGLTPKAYRRLGLSPDGLVLARWSLVTVRAPGLDGFPVHAPAGTEIRMVRRERLDQVLLERAGQAGAAIHQGEAALAHGGEPGAAWVATTRATYRTAAVISAEGASTRLGRAAGLVPRQGWPHALAVEMEGPARGWEGRAPLVDFRLRRGYFWVFPKGETLNAGAGTGDRRSFRHLKECLRGFLEGEGIRFRPRTRLRGHWLPAYPGHRPLAAGPLLLTGDAGWLVDPLFGEGISSALASGELAALAVLAFLDGELLDFTPYSRAIRHTLGRELEAYRCLARMIYRLPRLSFALFHHSSRIQRAAGEVIAGRRSLAGGWEALAGILQEGRWEAARTGVGPASIPSP